MKPLHNYIWVEVEKTYEDSTIINGKEIYINPTYNPELNTRQHGIVYSISKNINNIKVGDKVYCHHFLITDENRVNFIKDKLIYNIREPFVYATVRKGKLKMLNNWVFVKQTEELEENWSFICEKVYGNDGYYHFYEENCFSVEVKETNTIVVIATATGELGA